MKTKNIMLIILILEATLVLVGLLMKQDIWLSVICYWSCVLMKNISDYIDEGRGGRHA